MIEAAGHQVVEETPDVVLCDGIEPARHPPESEAPVIALADRIPPGAQPAGLLPRSVEPRQLDLALQAVAAGLQVRAPGLALAPDGFAGAEDAPPLTPREAEILTLVGHGLSNKAIARQLAISVHTVKFHLEALFAKLDATSRAEAVAKGLRGRAIEL